MQHPASNQHSGKHALSCWHWIQKEHLTEQVHTHWGAQEQREGGEEGQWGGWGLGKFGPGWGGGIGDADVGQILFSIPDLKLASAGADPSSPIEKAGALHGVTGQKSSYLEETSSLLFSRPGYSVDPLH